MRSACEYAYWVQVTGKDVDPSHAGIFWLRLFGVLVDLPKYLERVPDSAFATDATNKLRAVFSHDVLAWVQYRRDSECHVTVEGGYAPVRGNGVPRDTIKTKTLPGEPLIPWDQFDDALARVLHPYVARGVNPEHGLARNMAGRACNPLESLLVTLFNPLTQEGSRLGRPFVPSRIIRPPR